MRYAVCPRCWLRMRDPENEEDAKEHCPRCLGRLGMEIPLYRTAGPSRRIGIADEPEHRIQVPDEPEPRIQVSEEPMPGAARALEA